MTSWGDMVKWWHRSWRRQKEWLQCELCRAENYKKNDYNLTCACRYRKNDSNEQVVCDVAVRTGEASLRISKSKMRSRVCFETSWGDMAKWCHRSSNLRKEWVGFELHRAEDYNKVVCDVPVRTVCVALHAPVSRSCKTYPVTQTKQNNWTGEASLRPGKCKIRSRVLWWHLEGIWWNDDIGAEDDRKNDYNVSFTELKITKRMTTIWPVHVATERTTAMSRLCVTLRSARGKQACVYRSLRWEAEFHWHVFRGYGEMMTSGCALSSSHPTTRAFRFPCSACAAVGCALPCCIRLPITIAALQCMIFFSIGLLVLIGLCFFYRLETSAPGLSGYYWYNHI